MSYVFASYKVTHQALTGGNKTVEEGHLTLRPDKDHERTDENFHTVVDIIATNYAVSTDAVTIISFNVLPDTVS